MQMAGAFSILVEGAMKSTAVLAFAWLVAVLLRGKSAALRHVIWCLGFAGLLALPILSVVLPVFSLPIRDVIDVPDFVFKMTAHQQHIVAHPGAGRSGYPETSGGTLGDWRVVLMLVWAAGCTASLAQMIAGWIAIRGLKQRAKRFEARCFNDLATLMEVRRGVAILETLPGSMPMSAGILQPTIFLPSDAETWCDERLRMVMLHELAHVRRWDGASHLMARTALALYWWNPLAWAVWGEFLKERERAADDLVLRAGAVRPEYAGHLLEIARSMQIQPVYAWASIAMAARSQLEGRLSAILDSARDRQTPRREAVLAAVVIALAVIVPLAEMRGQTEQAGPDATMQRLAHQTDSLLNAMNLVKAGDQAHQQGKLDQAKSLYTKALGVEPRQPVALIHRGTVELEAKDFPAAMDDFEMAQKAGSGYASEALMWQAITQERDNKLGEAEKLYSRALLAADMRSLSAATTMDLFSHLLERQGKYDPAALMQRQAAAIRAAQPALLSTSTAHHIGEGGGSSPVLLSKVEPEYSAEARAAKYEGTVLLRSEIGADGIVRDIKVVGPLGLGLDEKAVEAVAKWKFKPGTIDGRPVAVIASIEVAFKLD
jgi:TonB family protein